MCTFSMLRMFKSVIIITHTYHVIEQQTPGWTCSACFVRNDTSDFQCKACGKPSRLESTTTTTASASISNNGEQSGGTSIDHIASLTISGAGKRRRLDPICELGGN